MAIPSGGFAAHVSRLIVFLSYPTVPDPDLEIRRGRSSRLLDKGGGGQSPKKIFSALRASVWSKNKGEGRGPSPGSSTALALNKNASALAYFNTIN